MAKILYVEDNLSLSFVTSDQLKKRGYQVVTCKDGKEALSTFNKNIFDLCILDVMLPIIDGFELAKKIRHENVHIPIIFLSARSMQEDKIEGLKIGGDDYLTKPFDIDELCLKIEVFFVFLFLAALISKCILFPLEKSDLLKNAYFSFKHRW